MFPHTKAAWKRLKWNTRAALCELLYSWAFKVRPEGYVPEKWRFLFLNRKP